MKSKSSIILFAIFLFSCIILLSNNIYAEEPTEAPPDTPDSAQPPAITQEAPPEAPQVYGQESFASYVKVGEPSNSGAASASIPIVVPPGRNGIAPNLALTYNSNGPNGWIGVGWDIGIGHIQRSTKRAVDYNGDDYVFMKNGVSSELVLRPDWNSYCPTSATAYGSKIEGAFSIYCRTTSNSWEVRTKDGTKYFFGYYYQTANSRQDNANGIFKWALDRVEDTNGNYMTITYWKDQGEIYINRIDYTGNTAGIGTTNSVIFYYESRTDASPMYNTAASVVTGYRLKTIEVYGNSQLARKYVLDYSYSATSYRSMLTSVIQHGTDGTTLPPVTLTWKTGATGFGETYWSGVIDWGQEKGRQWVDFNGDGKADYCRVLGSSQVACTVSTGTGFGQTPIVSGVIDSGWEEFRQWVDFNGDGKADYCRLLSSMQEVACTISTGTGFGQTYFSGAIDLSQSIWEGFSARQWVDFNGDGKADYCRFKNNQMGECHVECTISTGTGFGQTYSDYVGSHNPEDDSCYSEIIWVDVNGDGKTDYLRFDGARISTGTGFGATYPYHSSQGGYYERKQWADFNGDGKPDTCSTCGNPDDCGYYVWYCTVYNGMGSGEYYAGHIDLGHGAQAVGRQWIDFNGDSKADICLMMKENEDSYMGHAQCIISTGTGMGQIYWSGLIDAGYDWGRQWADFNGDGKPDYCRLVGDTNLSSSYVQCTTATSPVGAPIDDILVSISNGIGGTTTLAYLPSSSYDNCIDIDGKNVCLPFIVQTVSSISVNDGNGNISTTNYTFSGGYYDAEDREFRGFDYVMATDPAGTSTETWFLQDDIFKGLPYKQVTTDSLDNIYTWTENTYQSRPYSGVNFPYLIQKDDYVCDGAVNFQNGPGACKHARTSFVDSDYDTYGNIKHTRYEGDLAVAGDERDEYTEYDYFTTKWILSRPKLTYVIAGNTKVKTWFTNDSATGNLSTKTDCLSNAAPFDVCSQSVPDTNDPVTQYNYYTNGNLWKVYDPKNNLTTYEYDSATQTYATKITNALSQFATKTYDYRFGKPLTETDPNGNIITYTYDPFGRVENVIDPGSGAPAYAWKETYYDGLGRTIMTKTGGPDGKVIVAETRYNNRGLIEYTSLPYFENIETPRWAYYEYDPIGRVKQVTNPDGTYITKSYMQGRTTVIDADGHKKVEEKDVYGRLVKVEEYTGTNPSFTLNATTTYKYNVLGNLIEVKDAKNNLTTINYDTLSRKINMNDPDMGYWGYDYDKNGNLIWQKDAKGKIIQFQYDALNRITLKNYPTGTDIYYYYDQPYGQSCLDNNFTGRLSKVTDASGSEKYCYDEVGRGVKAIKTVGGVDYTTETTYDELGRMNSLRYPDQTLINYVYDDGGNLRQVPGYATYSGYNALGQVGSVTYGNNITTTYSYYQANDQPQWLNRLKSIKTGPSDNLQNLTYTYYNGGSIMGITDYVDSTRSQGFLYDALNRLTQAQSSAYGTITYNYDEIGNMTYNSQVGNYTYWKQYYGTKPHAVYQAGSNTYGYDNNGNMTSSPGKTITYNYDNKPVSINATTFVYDFSGQRVKKNSTIYIGKLYECTGSSCTKYIFAGSNRIAYKIGSATYYYHTDHLGSSSIITNASGNKTNELYYYPYGKTRYALDSSLTHKFTGQEEDEETGLYYYGARYYDPAIGRFVSADSMVPSPGNPQNLNRYTYCLNNPLIYTDPTGHFKFSTFLKSFVTGIAGGAAFVLTGGAAAPLLSAEFIGASMAAGAAAGATSAALNGGNIIQGALFGTALGAVGGIGVGIVGPVPVLVGGAAYATATGGLNGLAYYAGGVIGGIAGYGGAKYVKTNWKLWFPSPKDRYTLLARWEYSQSTGEISHVDDSTERSHVVGQGYAGHGEGLNNPDMQAEPNVGPPPEGDYSINPQQTNVTGSGTELPGSMRLIPDPETEMYGRGGFLIHGGNMETMDSSQGCIILPRNTRDIIGNSGDNALRVVP